MTPMNPDPHLRSVTAAACLEEGVVTTGGYSFIVRDIRIVEDRKNPLS